MRSSFSVALSVPVLILEDIVGFKGHGTVFRASESEISAYIKAPPGRPWPIALTPENQEA